MSLGNFLSIQPGSPNPEHRERVSYLSFGTYNLYIYIFFSTVYSLILKSINIVLLATSSNIISVCQGLYSGPGGYPTAELDTLCGHKKKLQRDREGYNRFEYTDKKLSTSVVKTLF